MVRQFHDGMRVQDNVDCSDAIPVPNWDKPRCRLAPTLFSIFTTLTDTFRGNDRGPASSTVQNEWEAEHSMSVDVRPLPKFRRTF